MVMASLHVVVVIVVVGGGGDGGGSDGGGGGGGGGGNAGCGGLAGMPPNQGPYSLSCRVEVHLIEEATEFFSLPRQPYRPWLLPVFCSVCDQCCLREICKANRAYLDQDANSLSCRPR